MKTKKSKVIASVLVVAMLIGGMTFVFADEDTFDGALKPVRDFSRNVKMAFMKGFKAGLELEGDDKANAKALLDELEEAIANEDSKRIQELKDELKQYLPGDLFPEKPILDEETKAQLEVLKEELKAAIEAGDEEAIIEIKEQIKALLPEGFEFKDRERPVLDEETKAQLEILKEELKAAVESGDKEAIIEIKEQIKELIPEGFRFHKGNDKNKQRPGTNQKTPEREF